MGLAKKRASRCICLKCRRIPPIRSQPLTRLCPKRLPQRFEVSCAAPGSFGRAGAMRGFGRIHASSGPHSSAVPHWLSTAVQTRQSLVARAELCTSQ